MVKPPGKTVAGLAAAGFLAFAGVSAGAPAKRAVWICQADHAMACGDKGCRMERNTSASIAFNRASLAIEVCLYSQCLVGKARVVRGAGSDLEQVWVRATSKPQYPNPITTVLMIRFDWRRKRFLMSRPGRIFHGGPCRAKG